MILEGVFWEELLIVSKLNSTYIVLGDSSEDRGNSNSNICRNKRGSGMILILLTPKEIVMAKVKYLSSTLNCRAGFDCGILEF